MSQDTIDTDVWSAVVALLRLKPPLSLIPVRCSLLGRKTLSSFVLPSFRAKTGKLLQNMCNIHRHVFSNLQTSIPLT